MSVWVRLLYCHSHNEKLAPQQLIPFRDREVHTAEKDDWAAWWKKKKKDLAEKVLCSGREDIV